MDHNGHMSMGDAVGLPELTEFPKFYWAVVGSAVGAATLVNIYNHILYRQRLSAARSGTQTPAKPKAWFSLTNATIFALVREASNFSVHIPLKNRILRLPTAGRVSLVLANLVTLVVLCLYGLPLNGRPIQLEDVGYRCGVVTLGQIPLMFLLSGKNNIIGFLSGISYERLNWLHRWCARCMLLTATIHMSYFFRSWAFYNYIGTQITTNEIVWKGLAAWCTLIWIVFSSMTPIRGWNYEVFVVQHLISFALFIAFVYIHIPIELKGYVWAVVALFFFDRTLRVVRTVYANMSLFHPTQRKQGQMKGFWACKAEFTPLPHNTTRVVISNPPISWTPGQHVFLSCHSIAPLQSHPFTIASIPEDGKMEFLIKAERGGTRRFFRHANKSHNVSEVTTSTRTVAIEGPYGRHRPLRQFDSVIFLAGSTGASFTFPLLRDILQGWKENASPHEHTQSIFGRQVGAATRSVRFAWIVKSKGQLGWFSEQLSAIYSEFENLQERLRDLKLEITVYVTCDESFTEEHRSLLSTITAPNHNTESKTETTHGIVQYRGPQKLSEKDVKSEKEDIEELSEKELNDIDKAQSSCGPDGACCCRTSVDENASLDVKPQACCCSPSSAADPQKLTSRPTSNISSKSPSVKQKLLVHPGITIYSGRPKTREIIRRSLEQALGESAVVVCGPHSLVADVKQDVCALSDERAVHKGTGAQGIYLHTESFSY